MRFVYLTAWAKILSAARFNQYALGQVRDLRSLSLLLSIGENGRYCLSTTTEDPAQAIAEGFYKPLEAALTGARGNRRGTLVIIHGDLGDWGSSQDPLTFIQGSFFIPDIHRVPSRKVQLHVIVGPWLWTLLPVSFIDAYDRSDALVRIQTT